MMRSYTEMRGEITELHRENGEERNYLSVNLCPTEGCLSLCYSVLLCVPNPTNL